MADNKTASKRQLLDVLGLYDVDGFPKLPRPGQTPDPENRRYVHVPSSFSELDDESLLDFLREVGALSAFAQEQLGLYSRSVEEANNDLRLTENETWRDLYPDGKPKEITLDQAKTNVFVVEDVAQSRHLRNVLVQTKMAVQGYSEAYARLAMMATQAIKYRTASGDRMPRPPWQDGDYLDTDKGDWKP